MGPVLRVVRAVAAVGAAAALLVPAMSVERAAAEDQTVNATSENTFTPGRVTIDPGDTVTWQWAGGFGHTVNSATPNWSKSSALGPPSTSFSTAFTFDEPGVYRYYCTTHGTPNNTGMRGIVTVRGATTTSPKPTTSPPRPPTSTTRPPTTPPSTASESPSGSPSPSASSATPVLPSGSASPSGSPTFVPSPTVAPRPSVTTITGPGFGPQSVPVRKKGLPFILALLLVGGVASAEFRALLANAPRD